MIRVDGGTFTMGGTSEQGSDAESDEKPAHQGTLSSYYIGETEVTQAVIHWGPWHGIMTIAAATSPPPSSTPSSPTTMPPSSVPGEMSNAPLRHPPLSAN